MCTPPARCFYPYRRENWNRTNWTDSTLRDSLINAALDCSTSNIVRKTKVESALFRFQFVWFQCNQSTDIHTITKRDRRSQTKRPRCTWELFCFFRIHIRRLLKILRMQNTPQMICNDKSQQYIVKWLLCKWIRFVLCLRLYALYCHMTQCMLV